MELLLSLLLTFKLKGLRNEKIIYNIIHNNNTGSQF